ncbi:MAG: hypothetical protein AAF726_20120 [Planctomycetota bacterium]
MCPFHRLALAVGLGAPAAATQSVTVERFATNPLLSVANVDRVTAQNLDRPGGDPAFVSFAGPSVVRVPDWVDEPLGRYYMYFAHHKGAHVRLAFANDLRGPWTVHAPGRGVLRLDDLGDVAQDHVASPDVHVDHARERFVMYVHAPLAGVRFEHRTFVTTSADGRGFELASDEPLGPAYFRAFHWRGHVITPSRLGPFLRSKDGFTNFETGPNLFDQRTRHYACVPWNDRLYVFYSRRNDNPERIRLRTIELADPARPGVGRDWSGWALSPPVDVLFPTESYESEPTPRALDPAVFLDDDGEAYLFYSGGHEQTICGARLVVDDWATLGVRNLRCASGARIGLAATPLRVGAEPWLGSDGTARTVPASVAGALLLQTAPGDVRSAEDARGFLRFEVSRPATVVLAHDTAMSRAPEWLDGWTDSGETLIVDDPRGPIRPPRHLQVWTRDVPAGAVSLGGNLPRDEPFGADRVMYVVAVR